MRYTQVLIGVTSLVAMLTSATAGTVDYQIVNPSNGDGGYQDLGTAYVQMDGVQSEVYAGGIMLAQNPGGNDTGVPNNYTTICTDINGSVYLGQTYSYQAPTVFNGLTGIDPTWGGTGTPAQSIQNAAAIFYQYGGTQLATTGITSLSTAQMENLQLAVWIALYDTSANGTITYNSSSRFQVLTGTGVGASLISLATLFGSGSSLYNAMDGGLTGITTYLGYLMTPTAGAPQNSNADDQPPQELLLAVTAVPEPTTMIAGAFLLVPFGMSTLRFVRKKRDA